MSLTLTPFYCLLSFYIMAQGEGTRQSTLKLPKLKTWNWDSRKGKAAGVCKAEYGRGESCIKILHGSAEVCSLVPINTCLVGNHQTYRKKTPKSNRNNTHSSHRSSNSSCPHQSWNFKIHGASKFIENSEWFYFNSRKN